jgi:hypothetical protein
VVPHRGATAAIKSRGVGELARAIQIAGEKIRIRGAKQLSVSTLAKIGKTEAGV